MRTTAAHFSLDAELEGQWPWRRKQHAGPADGDRATKLLAIGRPRPSIDAASETARHAKLAYDSACPEAE
jgi:hypothetical protein